jgi:hypothetical protein
MIVVTTVSGNSDLQQILDLQRENHRQSIQEEEMRSQGFVTMVYTMDLLTAMHELAPSIVIKKDNKVIAFALVFMKEGKHLYPDLQSMYSNMETLTWNEKPLSQYTSYVMGQICVAKEYRGQGFVDMLYQMHKELYGNRFDLIVTEISTSNHRSLRAHERIGFRQIATYRDHLDEWAVVIWDWSLPSFNP